MVVLKIPRPSLFSFEPGQYAYLRLSCTDFPWHLFSIASGPSSSNLEFYIEVMGDKSWTEKLWRLADASHDNMSQQFESEIRVDVGLMGPYGTSLVRKEDFSHVLAVGSGTGKWQCTEFIRRHAKCQQEY
jgi:NAD(P)H-flavin reductase